MQICFVRKNNLSWIYYLSKIKAIYGCENLSLTLGEERRLRVFENGVLRRIFRPERGEVTGEWENSIMRSLMICYVHLILFG